MLQQQLQNIHSLLFEMKKDYETRWVDHKHVSGTKLYNNATLHTETV